MKSEIIKEGYVVITPTLCQGDVMAWSVEEAGKEPEPEFFKTEEDAWKEIAISYMEQLQDFIDGHREFDAVDWNGPEDYVAFCTWYNDGRIRVRDRNMCPIIDTTIEKWRAEK